MLTRQHLDPLLNFPASGRHAGTLVDGQPRKFTRPRHADLFSPDNLLMLLK